MSNTPHPPTRIKNLPKPAQEALLNFLLKNNIQFKKDKENFIAQIIVKAKNNNQLLSPSKSHQDSQIKGQSSKPQKSPNRSNRLVIEASSPTNCANSRNNPRKSEKSTSKVKNKPQSNQQKTMKSIQIHQFSPHADNSLRKSNISLKKKINEDKFLHGRVNGYLKLFDVKLQGQKIIKWSLSHLLLTIHSIYDQAWLKYRKIKKNPQKIVIASIKEYFSIKFKTQKLINSHLINMLNSLTIFQQKIKDQKSSIQLQMFIKFITEGYEGQNFVFFLLVRDKVKKWFRIQQLSNQFMLNRHQIQLFLVILFQKNKGCIQLNRNRIMEHIKSETMQLSAFFKFMVECHQNKAYFCVKQEEPQIIENKDILIDRPVVTDFWECSVQQFSFDEVEMLVVQKLQKKARQLIQIILSKDNQNAYNSYNCHVQKVDRERVQSLLVGKSLILLTTVLQMNKIKWFRQLRIVEPGTQEVETVQTLQLNLKKIKENPNMKSIGEFCKAIITVPQLMQALQELII